MKTNNTKRNQIILYVLIGLSVILLVLFILSFVFNWGADPTPSVTPDQTTEAESDKETESEIATEAVTGSSEDGEQISVSSSSPTIIVLNGDGSSLREQMGIDGDATFSVADDAIASVDADGNIIGKSYGDTTVHVEYTDEDGNAVKTDVDVHIGTSKVNVTLSDYSLTIALGNSKTIDLAITDDAGNDISDKVEVLWEMMNENIARKNGNVVTGYQSGTTGLMLTVNCVEEKIGIGIPVNVAAGDDEEESLGHTHLFEQSGNTEASCTKGGTVNYACSCGAKISETVESLGHHYEVSQKTNATCTAEGKTTYKCARCGDSYSEVNSVALGHNHKEASKTAATCTKDGKIVYKCTRCNDSYSTTIAKTGHGYEVSSRTAPTCTEDGKIVYKCSKCGDSYNTAIAKTGHNYAESSRTASCTGNGKITYKCKNCGGEKTEALAKTDHVYEEYSKTAATCEAEGKIVYKCKNCGDTSKTETLAKTGHDYVESSRTAATCTAEGKIVYKCKNCDKSYNTTITATGHSYAETSRTAATCTTDGKVYYKCSKCGDTNKTETITKLGHLLKRTPLVYGDPEADVEQNWDYHKVICERCNDYYAIEKHTKESIPSGWHCTVCDESRYY